MENLFEMDGMFDFSEFYKNVAIQMPTKCRVVEIGVANGLSALYLANKLNELGKDFKLFMVDDLSYGGVLQLKTIYENIIKSGLGNSIEVIPFDSIKASKMFNGDSLDFVYLDSSHKYEETKKSIRSWYWKLKDGGILGGHDYDLYPSVKKAVDEVIPTHAKRKTLYDEDGGISQTFEKEQVLFTEPTTNGYGLFYCRKDFYIKLKK